ncbi:Signal transduction histidine kinase [Streptomyces sp. Ag82_O1-12]|uniref:sensor histidine kinase n=1 Tax=unclassified Streptomyces TaxID=2593676 RepID=UPI000BC7928E|nr:MULTISPECIES: histidine kinase [unclassified Streptomyces]SMQ18604.1 Signal transduction histidine kinase [Streptomyces sp. Ag82_O1-12]SOD47643.1 Signal transduction histidine kinase [Streptomyces sp. Ag82_G6-1]
MSMTGERTGLLGRRRRRAEQNPEITTPPAGTVLPPHVRTGAPDVPVTSVTPALPPGWEAAGGLVGGEPTLRIKGGGRREEAVPRVATVDAPGALDAPAQGTMPTAHGPQAQAHGRSVSADAAPPQAPAAPEDHGPTRGPFEAPVPAAAGPAGVANPAIDIQVNALQAMGRQVFGFRLAMIALATPTALVNANDGLPTRLVGAAVVVTFMTSYVLFRDWERFGPLLLRHPSLLAADTLFGALLLIAAGPDSTLAYVSVCTPLLAGLVYGWRGAAVFASLQALLLLLVHAAQENPAPGVTESALLPGLCVIAGAVGSSLRNLMLRFGAATQALTTVQARLAVTEAVSAERARLAREMHDSVAKTLHGVALAADGLTTSTDADRMDPALVRQQAALVARSARRAAAESRELLADLRRESDPDQATDVLVELAARTRDFSTRTGLPAVYRPTGAHAVPPVPPAVARQLLTIASEAMENAHRHARPTRVDVSAGVHGDLLRISVYDDGRGLPPGTTLEHLRRAGHFGLVGMVERAASVGARIRIGRGGHPQGTEVRLELPLAALTTPTA